MDSLTRQGRTASSRAANHDPKLGQRLSSLRSLIAVALSLTAATCGGGRTSTDARLQQSVPQAAATVAEWVGSQIEQSGQQNAYGPKKAPLLKRGADGVLAFTPETGQDHIAFPFVTLTSAPGDRAMELVTVSDGPAAAHCAATLQDQDFNTLAVLPCEGTGERKISVQVPSSVTKVRVVFLSAKLEPMHLPDTIRLLDHKP